MRVFQPANMKKLDMITLLLFWRMMFLCEMSLRCVDDDDDDDDKFVISFNSLSASHFPQNITSY